MRARRSTTPETTDGVVVRAAQLRTLLGSNGDLDLAASDLAESVERVGESTVESGTAAEAAAEATIRVEHGATAVAGAASQMAVAMHEVASSASAATVVTAEAAEVTAQVRAAVERLGASSTQIGGVVRTVAGISDQTRMLALNATIEAARAGSAGRGFAVVAEEVKNLAALTHEATTQIGGQLAALTADSEGVRKAAERIDDVLRRIDGLQQTIAAAVEEQTAAIGEITRSASEVAGAATDLDSSVTASVAASRRAADAVVRSRTWLEAVGHALELQRHEMQSLTEGIEVHPLRAAITAHAGWKRALREAIDTGRHPNGVDPAHAARADLCDFGQWLGRGEGDALDPARAALAAKEHAAFHQEAGRVLRAAVDRRIDEARHLLADEQGYAGAAGALTDLLVAWVAQVEATQG